MPNIYICFGIVNYGVVLGLFVQDDCKARGALKFSKGNNAFHYLLLMNSGNRTLLSIKSL